MTLRPPSHADFRSDTLPIANRITSDGDALRIAAELAADFADGAIERDRDGVTPVAELERIRQSGLLAIPVPAELGGAGASTRTLVDVVALLAAADGSIAQVLQNHYFFLRHALVHGTSEQREFFARLVIDGNRLGNAQAERNVGSTSNGPGEWTTALSASADDGVATLTGTKYYSTGAFTAQWIPVNATGLAGTSVIVYVPRTADGVHVTDDWNGFGQRGTHSGTTTLTAVRVADWQVVAVNGDVEPPRVDGAYGQIIHAALDVGIAQGALSRLAEFLATKTRVYRDSPAAKAAQDSHLLYETGKLAVGVRAARAVLHEAAEAIDVAGLTPTRAQSTEASLAVAAARAVAAETAVTTANELFEIAGTGATDRKYGLDRYWRDARTHTLHDPTRWKYIHIGNELVNGVVPSGSLI
ncbi:SfnB family sulfur acquisition oxidoreductase [Gordonia sp. TBRC 11910]|uniref:SfnB family sulfur acquisition oxidoreductase n=1 Tax=Gordonia asplenii TaxID=2725283 RepID=A0A848KSG4_9ACTN|nr:acyl-CoA dehydrogenase family protein [Gordonia asplenii]NMN99814.1 SfnB family sulfur acquisition oxidoreductase [Gordonia asplenii]